MLKIAKTGYDLNLRWVTCLCHSPHHIFWNWLFTTQYFLLRMQWQFLTLCNCLAASFPASCLTNLLFWSQIAAASSVVCPTSLFYGNFIPFTQLYNSLIMYFLVFDIHRCISQKFLWFTHRNTYQDWQQGSVCYLQIDGQLTCLVTIIFSANNTISLYRIYPDLSSKDSQSHFFKKKQKHVQSMPCSMLMSEFGPCLARFEHQLNKDQIGNGWEQLVQVETPTSRLEPRTAS